MKTTISKISRYKNTDDLILLCLGKPFKTHNELSKSESRFIQDEFKKGIDFIELNQLTRKIFVVVVSEKSKYHLTLEAFRNAGNQMLNVLNRNKSKEIVLCTSISKEYTSSFIEGFVLSNYRFDKYLTKKEDYSKVLKIQHASLSKNDLLEITNVCEGTFACRDLVNEPVWFLNTQQYAKEMIKLGKLSGFKVEILNKKKIESLKMGGLLAINKGSIDPPTFNILEWKPTNRKNTKPLILVGKGIVFDTGGLSLKPTPNSMDLMKSDMGGSAAVVGAMYSIAKSNLPYHIIGLIPVTDNRPGENAVAPGDIITMFDKTTVEVLNTDAEGRVVMADALSYAKKYKPETVIDIATLTGSAIKSIGIRASVIVGNDDKLQQELAKCGEKVYERLAILPFWEDYAEEMKSTIADLNNLGSSNAGAITAGKFLEHFVDNGGNSYPWAHIDIAGPSFLGKENTYRPAGGTGVGVRLIYDYVKSKCDE